MNKKALLDYALFARKELETQIALSLNKLGIYKDKILKANIVGDYTIIEGNPDSYPKRVYNLRKMMISEYFEGEEKKGDGALLRHHRQDVRLINRRDILQDPML